MPAHAPVGALVSVAQFARDARGPPLAVGRMVVDADKIDNGVTKGKAVLVLHTWKDHLWALGSKGEPPDALPVANEATGGAGDEKDGGDGTDENRGVDDAPLPSAGQEEPAENAPAVTQDGTAAQAEEIETLTPEGVLAVPFVDPHDVVRLHYFRSVHSSARCVPASSPNVPRRTPKFRVPDAYDHPVHGTYPPCARLLADSYDPRRHQALRVQVALRLSARVGEGGLAQAEGHTAGRTGCRGVPDTCGR